MKLGRRQLCPIHHRLTCCGREAITSRKSSSKWETVRPGVRRIRDQYADHPDGYRYKLSPAEMRKVLDRKIQEQQGICGICENPMEDYREVVPDHILPKGLGGSRCDDRDSNIQAAHMVCNQQKGSQREAGPKEIAEHMAMRNRGEV